MYRIMDTDLKELPEQFTGRGETKNFNFKQLKRSDKAYIYEISYSEIMYYEVFKRKINLQFNCVSYPGSKSFGVHAKTTPDLMRALEIFESYNK